jgi:exonuclease SbcD
MRFLHTADWHLGRLFHGVHLTDDQAYVLDRFVELVRDVRPDAVVVSGDVYDRSVPPDDAVALLNSTLDRVVRGERVPVVLIAGNHDSAGRLSFAASLLERQGLHIAGAPSLQPMLVGFDDPGGPVYVAAIPYADPAQTRAALGDETIHDHEAALRALVARARAALPRDARALVVTHAFVAGGLTSESERPLSVGGAGSVSAEVFEGFDYVALGHLHRPQTAGDGLRYAGSLLKYSFAEHDHAKSVAVVELGARRGMPPLVELVTLPTRRDVRVVEGTLRDILAAGRLDPAAGDYVCARLLDRGALLNPMGQLREAYPNALHIERPELTAAAERPEFTRPDARSEAEHFATFFEYVCDEPLSDIEREAFTRVADRLERQWREEP